MTNHNRIPTKTESRAAAIAGWLLAIIPFSFLLALVFYGDFTFPWVAKLLEALQ